MPTTYYLDDTSIGQFVSTGPAVQYVLLKSTGTSGTLGQTVPAESIVEHYHVTPSGEPGSSGGSGIQTYTLEVNVTTANANINISTYVARVNSGGTLQTSFIILGQQSAASTGVKTFSADVNVATFAAGDRLVVRILGQSIAMHGDNSWAYEIRTTDSEFVAPWTLGPASSLAFPRKDRRHLALRSFDRWTVTGWR